MTGATVADTMAVEWMHIMSQEHAAMQPTRRERLFDTKVNIPKHRRGTREWNIALTGEIREGEVLRVIKSMARHKAPGLD